MENQTSEIAKDKVVDPVLVSTSSQTSTIKSEKKSGKGWMYVAIIAILLMLLLCGALFYTVWMLDKKNKELDTALKTTPTPTATLVATQTSTPTVTSTATATPTPTNSKNTYVSTYLDINFQYPTSWTVSEIDKNNAASGYAVDCTDDLLVNSLMKNKSLCVNGEAEPKNIIVQDGSGNTLTFWMADGLGGACQECVSDTITLFNKSTKIDVLKENNKVTIFIGHTFTTGTKSAWKSYIFKFSVSEAKYSEVKDIIASIKYN